MALPIDQQEIINIISKALYPIDDVDHDMLRSIGLIATRVLGGRSALKREKDPTILYGLIFKSIWDEASITQTTKIISSLKEAINKNKGLTDARTISKSKPRGKMEPGSPTLQK